MALFSTSRGLFVVTPVVAFYMLLDWDRMVATVDSWVPRDHVETVRDDRHGHQHRDRRLRSRAGHAVPRPWHLCMPSG